MTVPAPDHPIPGRVRDLVPGARLTPVWVNGHDAVTVRAESTDGIRFVKFGPRNAETTVEGEADRLRWAGAYAAVPEVLQVGGDDEDEWLVTRALPGVSAVAQPWIERPEVAVRAVGEGLRALHEALPVEGCPFGWEVPQRIEAARARGIHVPDVLRSPPPVEVRVVCHGDACVPNTLLDERGDWTGHVDLGALGTGDRWADIAVAALSTVWNYGPGWEEPLVEAYGLPLDRERMTYYQALWNAT